MPAIIRFARRPCRLPIWAGIVAKRSPKTPASLARSWFGTMSMSNDEALRTRSNRTFYRVISGLNPEVAKRYGYDVDSDDLGMEVRLQAAIGAPGLADGQDIARS